MHLRYYSMKLCELIATSKTKFQVISFHFPSFRFVTFSLHAIRPFFVLSHSHGFWFHFTSLTITPSFIYQCNLFHQKGWGRWIVQHKERKWGRLWPFEKKAEQETKISFVMRQVKKVQWTQKQNISIENTLNNLWRNSWWTITFEVTSDCSSGNLQLWLLCDFL